jgi:hypothetical protein
MWIVPAAVVAVGALMCLGLLHRASRADRDAKIKIARQECVRTLADLDRIAQRMDVPIETQYSPAADGLSSTAHAQAILTERGPLPLLEIAVDAQARGYRPGKQAQRIMHVLHGLSTWLVPPIKQRQAGKASRVLVAYSPY